MEIRYQRNLNHNYLIIVDDNIAENDYQLQMITKNAIKGLLNCTIHRVDSEVQLYYEISSRYPLKQMYERKKMSYRELKEVLMHMLAVTKTMEEYLLDERHLLFGAEFIYINPGSQIAEFCFYPGYSRDVGKSFHEVIEYILDCVDYKDEKAVALAYELYKCTAADNCSVQELLDQIIYNSSKNRKGDEQIIEEKQNESNECKEKEAIANIEIQEQDTTFILTNILKSRKDIFIKILGIVFLIIIIGTLMYFTIFNYKIKNIIIGGIFLAAISIGYIFMKKEKFEELLSHLLEKKDNDAVHLENNTVQFNKNDTDSDKTVAEDNQEQNSELEQYEDTLYVFQKEKPNRLAAENKNQFIDFELQWFPFLIGKLKDAVDGIVEDESVSRIHAKIEKEDDKYYIKDLNSTNGTYVNQTEIYPDKRLQIQKGDIIRFGRVVYRFE